VDHITVEEFERHLEANLEKLSQALKDGSYRCIPVIWPQCPARVSE
jgi:hypothetical protein